MFLKVASVYAMTAAIFVSLARSASAQGIETLLAQQGANVVAGELSSRKISDIINELRAAGASLIGQAANEGNGLAARLGNEMTVAAINAANAFGGQLNNTVAQASAEAQPVLAALNYVAANHKKLLKETYRMKDTLVMDLRAISWRVTGDHFFIQTIDGTAQIPKKEGVYRISVIGTGLGIPSSTLKSESKLFIGNKHYNPIPPQNAYTATFEVPVADLQFMAKKLRLVNATLKTTQSVKSYIFGWKRRPAPDVDISIGLYPLHFAQVSINSTHSKFEWVKARDEGTNHTTGDHNCATCSNPPKTPYTLSIKVPNQLKTTPQLGDQQLKAPKLECLKDMRTIRIFNRDIVVDASACGWTSITSVNLSENNSRADGKWLSWGSPTTWRFAAEVWEFTATGEAKEQQPAQDVEFDSIVEFDVPAGQGSFAVAVGKTYSNEKFEFVLGNNTDMLTLQKQALTPTGRAKYLYVVGKP
jgi:hypothetical protein